MQRYVFFLNLQALRRFFLKKKFSLKPRRLFISFPRRKETKQRKFAGYVPEAKICTFFLKKKNSFHSNSFFFLTEKRTNFFTLLHSCRKLLGWMVTKRCFVRFLGCPADGCRTLLRSFGDVLRSFVTSFLRMTSASKERRRKQ